MENASKALYIAGGVLIALLVLSLFVYMFLIGARFAGNYESAKGWEKIQAFNEKFEVYHKADNTITDVVTAANLAYSINKQNGYDDRNAVRVKVYLGSSTSYLEVRPSISPVLEQNYFFTDTTGTKQISSYYLMSKTIDELKSELGSTFISVTNGATKLTDVTKFVADKPREYRYYFNVAEIGYNFRETQLVNEVVFRLEENNTLGLDFP